MPQNGTEQVIREFNERNTGSDFSPVVRHMQDLQRNDPGHWQQNLERINREVDMRRLGFPDDFQITGVTGSGVLTRPEAAGGNEVVLVRDPQHLSICGQQRNEHWGQRDFRVNPDGSASYTVRQGDNLSHIARDVLSHELGRAATPQEIARRAAEIARENNIADPNKLRLGQELRIAGPSLGGRAGETAEAGAQPRGGQIGGVELNDPKLGRQNDGQGRPNYNPLMPRGLGEEQDSDVRRRQTEPGGEPGQIRVSGALRDGWLRDTTYTGEIRVGPDGKVRSSRIEYSDPISLPIRGEGGRTQELQNVRSVETQYNDRTQTYETTIQTSDGKTYRAITGPDGRVRQLQELNALLQPQQQRR